MTGHIKWNTFSEKSGYESRELDTILSTLGWIPQRRTDRVREIVERREDRVDGNDRTTTRKVDGCSVDGSRRSGQ